MRSRSLRASSSLSRFTVNPAMAESANNLLALARMEILCNRLWSTIGSITLSWKLPDWPATVMAASLPISVNFCGFSPGLSSSSHS